MGRTVTRAVLRRLHRWIGLTLALPLILQALTGLVLAVDPLVAWIGDIPAASEPLISPGDIRNVDPAAVLAAAAIAVESNQTPSRWRVLPNGIVAIDFSAPGQAQPVSQVGVDVVSMTALWARQDPDSLYRWAHTLHETLLLGPMGRSIIGWVGVGLLLLALSGIPLWWPSPGHWRAGFTVSRNASGRRLQRELHSSVGIWVLLLLLLQSTTGIALAFPQTARILVGLPAGPARGARQTIGTVPDPAHAFAVGIATARAAVPNAALEDLRLSPVPQRPMFAILRPDNAWAGAPRAIVTMDPATARVLSIQDPRTDPPSLSVLDWLRAAHQGGAAGPAQRMLLCLFALVLPLFPITGVAMWTLRRRRQRRTQAGTIMAGQ
jgi:uncharacterized iron-regulated membrane protein